MSNRETDAVKAAEDRLFALTDGSEVPLAEIRAMPKPPWPKSAGRRFCWLRLKRHRLSPWWVRTPLDTGPVCLECGRFAVKFTSRTPIGMPPPTPKMSDIRRLEARISQLEAERSEAL